MNASSMNMKSSRKYAVQQGHISPSPLARDNTTVVPLRLKKKDSFSTSQHTHGLGGEAKDAMLRNSGIRMRRSSLRIIATKGNAVLSAAISHKVFVPELELFLRGYARKEDEFAESIPSAMCPFQFIQHDSSAIVPFQRTKSSGDVKEAIDPAKLNEWLTDMRLKVHMRLVQRQVTTVSTPIEGHKLDDKRPTTPMGHTKLDLVRKGSDLKRGGLDSDRKGGDTNRKKGSDSDRKKQDSDRKKKGDLYDTLDQGALPARSNSENKVLTTATRAETPPPPTPAATTTSNKSGFMRMMDPRKGGTRGGGGGGNTRGGGGGTAQPYDVVGGNQPLFQARKNPTLTRRTHSAYDVRRVRLKARNSVGLEPVW